MKQVTNRKGESRAPDATVVCDFDTLEGIDVYHDETTGVDQNGHGSDGDLPMAPEDGTVDSDGATQWHIKCFDPSVMKADATVLLLGKRGTGKSTLLQDLMYHVHTRLFAGIAMAPTEDSVTMFESFLPRCFVFNNFSVDAVERLMQTKRVLSRMNRKKQSQAELEGKEFVRRHVAVLLDDCMYEKKNLKHTAIRDIFMNGRHEDVFFMNLQQYVMDMSPDMRNQVDYIFALRDTSMENRVKLWKTFFGMFSDYSDFSEVFDRCTENYECLVLCNRSQSNDWRDCIYWYKAMSPVPKFRIGHPVMWYLNYRYASLPCEEDAQNEALIKSAVAKTFFATGDAAEAAALSSGRGAKARSAASTVDRKLNDQIEKARNVAAQQELQKQALMRAKKKKVIKLGSSALQAKHEESTRRLQEEADEETHCKSSAGTTAMLPSAGQRVHASQMPIDSATTRQCARERPKAAQQGQHGLRAVGSTSARAHTHPPPATGTRLSHGAKQNSRFASRSGCARKSLGNAATMALLKPGT